MKKAVAFLLVLCAVFALSSGLSRAERTEGLEVYYLDVGQGNAAVVLCGDCAMMIDGGPARSSNYVYSFLKSHKISRLDYLVATHNDEDHVGGLSGALNYATAGIVLGLDGTPSFRSFSKYLEKQNNHIIVPDAGDVFSLGDATVTVLGPERGEVYSKNTSLVLRVEYGETSFLFMGDAETEDEDALLTGGNVPASTVLSVGHHGSGTSSSDRFLDAVDPEIAVISVGAGNPYGHPHDNILLRLQDHGAEVYRTDLNGQIVCRSDGTSVTVTVEKAGDTVRRAVSAEEFAAGSTADGSAGADRMAGKVTYVGNANSYKFHLPDCPSVSKMKEENKVFFYGDRSEPVEAGYKPCGNCRP